MVYKEACTSEPVFWRLRVKGLMANKAILKMSIQILITHLQKMLPGIYHSISNVSLYTQHVQVFHTIFCYSPHCLL